MDTLYFGAAREVITPPIGGQLYGYNPDIRSTEVADDLTATAFYFAQGETKALMITATVCLIQTELADKTLDQISALTGVPRDAILLSATHTHSGPNVAGSYGWGNIDTAYCQQIFIPKLLCAAQQAVQNAVPARMQVAQGKSDVGINRRQLSHQNHVGLGQNPWAPYNPNMTVLTFTDEKGKVLGNLIHYGCHGTAAGANTEITRDWSGHMTDALEAVTGGITGFFNGPEGDVGPRISNGKTTGNLSYVKELGARAAADALRVYRDSLAQADVSLQAMTVETKVPLKSRIPVEEAQRLRDKFKDCTVNIGGQIRYQMEQILESYDNGGEDLHAFCFGQTYIRLGNVVFVAFPFELFSEIGMRIDEYFPDLKVLSLSNTNGSAGYMVTEDAICRGGYEVEMFQYGRTQEFCDNADFCLFQAAVDTIQSFKEEA